MDVSHADLSSHMILNDLSMNGGLNPAHDGFIKLASPNKLNMNDLNYKTYNNSFYPNDKTN